MYTCLRSYGRWSKLSSEWWQRTGKKIYLEKLKYDDAVVEFQSCDTRTIFIMDCAMRSNHWSVSKIDTAFSLILTFIVFSKISRIIEKKKKGYDQTHRKRSWPERRRPPCLSGSSCMVWTESDKEKNYRMIVFLSGAASKTWTRNLLVRSQALYPVEL